MSKRISDGIRDTSGFLKHGHTYQAHPIACAASLAVQKVVNNENLLKNSLVQGEYLRSLLEERLLSPNSPVAPFVFDIRGSGAWWAIEFDFDIHSLEKPQVDLKGRTFGDLIQAKCMDNGLVIMGFHGGSNVEGTKGDHAMFSPAYNVTKELTEEIADIFVKSAEDVVKSILVQ